MFKKRNKIESNVGVRKSENRILRMLRLGRGFKSSPVGLEEKDQENAWAISLEENRNALSEVEYNKAQALLALQQEKQRFY